MRTGARGPDERTLGPPPHTPRMRFRVDETGWSSMNRKHPMLHPRVQGRAGRRRRIRPILLGEIGHAVRVAVDHRQEFEGPGGGLLPESELGVGIELETRRGVACDVVHGDERLPLSGLAHDDAAGLEGPAFAGMGHRGGERVIGHAFIRPRHAPAD